MEKKGIERLWKGRFAMPAHPEKFVLPIIGSFLSNNTNKTTDLVPVKLFVNLRFIIFILEEEGGSKRKKIWQ